MTKKHVSLKSAAEDKDNASVAKSLPTFMVDPNAIVWTPGANGRPIDPEHVAAMREAWENGIQMPPVILYVEDGEFRLLAGQHRMSMYMGAIKDGKPIERIPAVEFKGDEKARLFAMLGENSGAGWTMMQLGHLYAQAVNQMGMTYAEVAKKRGRSAQHVKDCIQLTEQGVEIKDAIADGAIAPAAALKLVKAHGATEAKRVIKQARHDISAGVKAPKGGKITQKVIDNLARSKVDEASVRGKQIKDHLSAMLESPSFGREVKDAIRKVMKAIGGRLPEAVTEVQDIDHVGEYLREQSCNKNEIINRAARSLQDARAGKFIPDNASPEAAYYGNMLWLEKMSRESQRKRMRDGARWFLALIDANRSDKEVAPPPSILSLDEAIQAEIDSGGSVRAETVCPEHGGLVAYLRSSH